MLIQPLFSSVIQEEQTREFNMLSLITLSSGPAITKMFKSLNSVLNSNQIKRKVHVFEVKSRNYKAEYWLEEGWWCRGQKTLSLRPYYITANVKAILSPCHFSGFMQLTAKALSHVVFFIDRKKFRWAFKRPGGTKDGNGLSYFIHSFYPELSYLY